MRHTVEKSYCGSNDVAIKRLWWLVNLQVGFELVHALIIYCEFRITSFSFAVSVRNLLEFCSPHICSSTITIDFGIFFRRKRILSVSLTN